MSTYTDIQALKARCTALETKDKALSAAATALTARVAKLEAVKPVDYAAQIAAIQKEVDALRYIISPTPAPGAAFTVTDDSTNGKVWAENNFLKCMWSYKALAAENGNRSGGSMYGLWDKTNDSDCTDNLVQVWDTGAGTSSYSPSRAGVGGFGGTKALVSLDTNDHSKAICEVGSRGTYVSHSVAGTDPVVATFVFDVNDAWAGRGWTHYRVTKEWTVSKAGVIDLAVTYDWVGHSETVHNDGSLAIDATSIVLHAGEGDLLAAAPTDHGNYHWAALLEHDGEVVWLVGAAGNVNGLDGRTSADTFLISRGYGGTTAKAHAPDSAWTVVGEYANDPNINFMVSRDYGYTECKWWGHDWGSANCPGNETDGWDFANNSWMNTVVLGVGNTGPEFHSDVTGAWEDYGTKHHQFYRFTDSAKGRTLDIQNNPGGHGYEHSGMFETGYALWRAVGNTDNAALSQITGELSTYRTTASYGHAARVGTWFSSDGAPARHIPVPFSTVWTDNYRILIGVV